ncbi:MAG: helix-turn-helix domain-containing protein [Clostridia bacterium]
MAKICYIGKNLKVMGAIHSHSCWEFVYCVNGEGCMTTGNGGSYFYSKNQLLASPPNVEHINTYHEGFQNIHFTVEEWHPDCKIDMVISDSANKDMLQLLEMCCRYFNAKFNRQEVFIQSFSDLILQLIALYSSISKVSDTIQVINNSIIENFNNPNFDLEQVFAQFDLTSDYLRRQYIKERGFSPLQFLTKTRIEFAKKMLTSQSSIKYKICDIAEMSGFNDQLYFSRMFKKYTSLSPKDFATQELRQKMIEIDR